MSNKSKEPRVLFLDIETSPIKGYTWTIYDANVLKVIEPSKIICVAWKWLGEKTVTCKSLIDYPNYKAGVLNDEKLVKDVWAVLDEADVIIAHNGDSFDLKKLNSRFIAHNLSAPSIYKTIDTLKTSRKLFKFESNSLDALGKYLHEGQKEHTGGFDLWDQCINGDKNSWLRMKIYNTQDIVLLENIYLRLRPFIADHPNLNVISKAKGGSVSEVSCPSCQSSKVTKRGSSVTRQGIRQRYQCNDCGSWSSGALHFTKDVGLV